MRNKKKIKLNVFMTHGYSKKVLAERKRSKSYQPEKRKKQESESSRALPFREVNIGTKI